MIEHIKKIPGLALAGLIFLSIQGCGTTAKFVYPANGRDLTRISDRPAYQQKVAVVPFEDLRDDKNQSGTILLYLIPLMPFGWNEYERPDAARGFLTVKDFQFDVSEDLAKAAALSLRKSGLFEDAFFTFGGDKGKAEYLFEGSVHSTRYKGTMLTYGLSVFGPDLWFIGLPAGSSYNELSLTLKMTELSTGRIIWEGKYDVSKSVTHGLYYNWGHDVRGYAGLMQDVMNNAVKNMNLELQRRQTIKISLAGP